jgi:hypothetical protein
MQFIIILVLGRRFHPSFIFDDFLSLPYGPGVYILNIVLRLKRTKSVGLGDIPSFVIILAPVLQYIFSVSLSLQHFSAPLKQRVVVSVFRKGESAPVVAIIGLS